ncbi:Uncharacterised protein [Mycobacteroides abscessus subsp. abscessus]|uniref:hypothetical protein n=1 Tax=Mycobacteroides abscessus TaxID=36809 RepID=UPI000928A621|nr:hypothetical protein [Mycobacteroides abscessus]MDM2350561.1 hypothetical protein [Mycobacteroides abscessus]MDM2357820.1 hypothetical protein [Mycobacteroides abscessus]QSN50893.1 hypothetical protein I3U39_19105 [Mycobacteroides abscessus subsp. abscessus]SHU93000.1 Uncharacterised protein [Mycobacteroides abscessus subsp. abscessus]SII21458.1 Uncharacterised protein [Mycobacteroides abscessus subsp. abscessus]
MKRKLARALRHMANRIDPTPNSQYVTAQERVARAQRDLDAARRCEQDVYERFGSAGRVAAAAFENSLATKIVDGIACAAPALPNAAGAIASRAPWWRRLLHRFGR